MKIINNTGIGFDTQVLLQDGTPLHEALPIEAVSIEIRKDTLVTAKLDICFVRHLDAEVDDVQWFLPARLGTGPRKVRAVEFEDGSRLSFENGDPVWMAPGFR